MPLTDNYETEAQELKVLIEALINNASVQVKVKADQLDYQFMVSARAYPEVSGMEVTWLSPSLNSLCGQPNLRFLARLLAGELIHELGRRVFTTEKYLLSEDLRDRRLYLAELV